MGELEVTLTETLIINTFYFKSIFYFFYSSGDGPALRDIVLNQGGMNPLLALINPGVAVSNVLSKVLFLSLFLGQILTLAISILNCNFMLI